MKVSNHVVVNIVHSRGGVFAFTQRLMQLDEREIYIICSSVISKFKRGSFLFFPQLVEAGSVALTIRVGCQIVTYDFGNDSWIRMDRSLFINDGR